MTAQGDRPGRGRFITLEGPDGAGKTSQAEILCRALRDAGWTVTLVREPGGTVVGERIRDLLLADRAADHPARLDALLFNAARTALVTEVIRPALERGEVVVSARFADSTVAYQGNGGGLPVDDLRALERFATGGLKPDLTILLDLPVEVGLGRKSGAEVTRFEERFDVAFHRRVRDGFLAIAAAEPDRLVVVDATSEPSIVARAIAGAVEERLPGLLEAAGSGVGSGLDSAVGSGGQSSTDEPKAARPRIIG
ncbi:MAG: dTMP kinase [Candidatus Limnocylindrales bacterium]